jgi:hypothetical protein
VVLLGVVVLVLCLVVGASVALNNPDTTSLEAFGRSVSDLTIAAVFGLGAAVGALAVLGLGLMLAGAARKRAKKVALKREVQHVRSEQETLAEENARLAAQLEQERATSVHTDGERSVSDADRAGSRRGRHGA